MKQQYSLLILLLLLSSPLFGGGSGESSQRLLRTQGVGTVEAEPDLLIVEVGVAVLGPTAIEASREAQARMDSLFEALEAAGVPEKNVETTNLSVYLDEREPGSPQYRVQNMVRVTSNLGENPGNLIDTLLENGANQLMGVRFGVRDPERHLQEARRQAVQDARLRAELLAEEAGVTLGGVIELSQTGNGGAGYYDQAMLRGAGGSTPVSPGTLTFRESVTVVYTID